MRRVKFVIVLVMVVALLGCIPSAMASSAACEETVNPHGITVPPAGHSTLPGPKGGVNDDGFFNLTALGGPGIDWVNITVIDKGADNEINESDPFNITDSVNADNTYWTFTLLPAAVRPGATDFYLRIKYTEANGAEPSIKEMATSGKENNGQSKAVAFHIKGQGDFAWVADFYDENNPEFPFATVGPIMDCLVPPPPKGTLPNVPK